MLVKELVKCRSFAEVYNTIGEEGFQKGAMWLLIYFCIHPFIAGIINFIMLLDIPSYDPYLYNDRWMMVSNSGFIMMTIFFLVYLIGKIRSNGWDIEDFIKVIRKREPWMIFWICLLVWGLFTCFSAGDIKGAFLGATELSAGYISHIYMLCVMGCAYLLNDEGRKKVMIVYVIISDFCALVMLAFEHELTILWWFTGYSGLSVFTNSNHYGYYLAMAIPCLVGLFYMSFDEIDKDATKSKAWCIICLLSFVIHAHAMVINDCMGAFLGAFFAMIFLIVFWRIKLGKSGIIYFIPMFILITMVYLSYIGVIKSKLGPTTGTSLIVLIRDILKIAGKKEGYEKAGTNRIFLWKEAIAAIARKPILGYGPDNMYDRWNRPCISMTPHNEFLECAVFMGIPGLIMYLGGLIMLFVTRIKKLKNLPFYTLVAACSVIAYQISAFFGVRKYHTVAYMFMFLGMIILKEDKDKKGRDDC